MIAGTAMQTLVRNAALPIRYGKVVRVNGTGLEAHLPGARLGDLVEVGVRAGCEFDKNSAGPIRAHTMKLRAPA